MLGAHREDDRARLVLVVVDPDACAARRRSRARCFVALSVMKRVPKRSAWSRSCCIISGPMIALGVAGEVLDVGRLLEQAAPHEALDDERVQVRARGVERGGVAGRSASDDDHVLDVLPWMAFAPFSESLLQFV